MLLASSGISFISLICDIRFILFDAFFYFERNEKNMKTENIKIKQINISTLKPAEYNPRQSSEKEYNDLKDSMRTFGIVDPIIVNSAPNRRNTVIGGHFRLRIAKELGYIQVPVVNVNIPDIKKEKELNLRLNKNLGQWDYDLLANFDEKLLKKVGFGDDELDNIFQLNNDEKADQIPELRKTDIKQGDIFVLGNHRLMCGDSTLSENLNKLLNWSTMKLCFTSPPYNMDGNFWRYFIKLLNKADCDF